MIIEGLLNVVRALMNGIIHLLPSMSTVSLPNGLVEWFVNIVNASAYFLPIADFFIMFSAWIIITNFSFFWKLILKIWDAIPFTFK